MPTRPSPRLSVTIILTIVAGILAALAGILGNIAVSTIPQATPYLRLAWPALGVSVRQVRRESKTTAVHAVQTQTTPPVTTPVSSPSQATSGIHHSGVLSYATADQPFAEKLHADLQQVGVSCWFASHDLKTRRQAAHPNLRRYPTARQAAPHPLRICRQKRLGRAGSRAGL